MDEPTHLSLPLGEAILDWSDPAHIENIRTCERDCLRSQLHALPWPRLVPDEALRQPTRDEWMHGGSGRNMLTDAWRRVEHEFRRKMRAAELHLSGVMIKPQPTTVPSSIPGVWASEFRLDLVNDVIVFGNQRFASVRASHTAFEATSAASQASSSILPRITPENVRELFDDEVLLLLEEHARRVAEGPDSRLMTSQKVSFGPILLRKMRLRCERGEMRLVLAQEAHELGEWLKTKVQSHPIPTTKSIENLLREHHRDLKPRSRPMMP